ncbi:unnamed protein product [Brachionus calyciflorus]|uniref:MULE transposase domain-containing protein n=1 Tax=Brachionus calyciflorus TaxID=104777 RepID=A0A814CI64_9BILA|nr:unnamed protein product [Brachionus calyciflorus]
MCSSCLWTIKNEEIYLKFLKVIESYLSKPPNSITSDFELAFLNAVKLVFPSKNWVGYDIIQKKSNQRNAKSETIHKNPRFDIDLWNIYDRINDCLPRTNNFVEAWHKAFSNMLSYHPSVYALVDKFREEQKKNESELLRLETGVKYKRKPAYIILDERIREIQNTYSLENFEKYYENLSLILDY